MKHHPVRKSVVALATVLSFLLLLASPAASTAVVKGGTLTIGNPPFLTFPLGEEAEDPPCDAVPNEVGKFGIWFEGDEEAGTWNTFGGFAGAAQIGANWFKFEFDFNGLAGSYVLQQGTPPPPPPPWVYDLTGGGVLNVHVYSINIPNPPDPEEPCEKKEFLCTIAVPVALVPVSTYTAPGAPPPPPGNGAGGQLSINAVSVAPHIQTIPQCPLALWILHGQPAAINNLLINL